MRIGIKVISSALLGMVVLSGCARDTATIAPVAAVPAPAPTPAPAPAAAAAPAPAPAPAAQPALNTPQEKASYGVGAYFGNQIKRGNLDVNFDVMASAIKDVLEGRELKLNEQQGREAIMAYQQQRQREIAAKNLQEGEAFLAQNKNKEGVQTLTVTLADDKTAELQYKVLAEGAGESPTSNDTVAMNFRGTLINGKEFDNSAKRGQPLQVPVSRTPMRALTEVLPKMKVGSKWELYVPASLAYGERGGMNVEPGATVILEVELVSVVPTPPPASASPAQPTTSDIIKVPSAEEMKAGAKIEVIKASDLEKRAAEQNSGGSTNKN